MLIAPYTNCDILWLYWNSLPFFSQSSPPFRLKLWRYVWGGRNPVANRNPKLPRSFSIGNDVPMPGWLYVGRVSSWRGNAFCWQQRVRFPLPENMGPHALVESQRGTYPTPFVQPTASCWGPCWPLSRQVRRFEFVRHVWGTRSDTILDLFYMKNN